MAIIVNISKDGRQGNARKHVYKDASFKNIGNTLPSYIRFLSSDVIVSSGRSYVNVGKSQRTPRKIFTSSGRRYDVLPSDVAGESVDITRIVSAEGGVDGTWMVQMSGIYRMAENSLYDAEAIRNSIVNIFTFTLRERVLIPDFGSCLNDIIGMPLTDAKVVVIKEMVEKMLEWERRVSVNDVAVRFDADSGVVSILLAYSIPALNVRSTSFEMNISIEDE